MSDTAGMTGMKFLVNQMTKFFLVKTVEQFKKHQLNSVF